MADLPALWIVWRSGWPDPSRSSPEIHYDDPARDRDKAGRLDIIPVAPEHRGMSIRELLAVDAYNLPPSFQTSIEGEVVLIIGDKGKRVPAPVEGSESW